MFALLHNYFPSPVLLDLGAIQIRWYGLLIALSLVLGFFIFQKLAKRAGFKKQFIFDLFFWLVVWGIVGARLYHVFSEAGYYLHHPLRIFYVWQGGFGIYGAVLAGVLVILYFNKKHKDKNSSSLITHSPYLLLDLLTPMLAFGQAIGRWGNYFNQELYGLPTDLLWGIPIDIVNRLAGYQTFTHFHPLFLYESLFCLAVGLILFFVVYKKKNKNWLTGSVFFSYIILYSMWRFMIELLRIDPQPIFLSLRLGQWVSLMILLVCVVVLILRKNKKNNVISTDL